MEKAQRNAEINWILRVVKKYTTFLEGSPIKGNYLFYVVYILKKQQLMKVIDESW